MASHFSGPIVTEGNKVKFYSKTLSSGSVTIDASADGISTVVGGVATRKSTGGGAAVEVTWSGTTVTVSDGSGSSSSVVSVILWGTE